MRKTVGIDAHVLGDHSGGNESYYFNLINHFTVDENVRLVLFIQPDYDIKKINIECDVVRFKSKNPLVRNFIEIPQLVNTYKIDVLHMQYFIPFHVSCKVIVTIHDISFEHFSDIFTKKDYFTQKILIPYAAKHSDLIFTVSEYSKQDIVAHYRVPEEKVIVTYNGVADSYYKKNNCEKDMDVLQKHNIKEPYILTVGNLQPRKNLKRLLNAFDKLLTETGARLQLVIVGKRAWLFDDLFSEINHSCLKGQIVLTDYLEETELAGLYRKAMFFVYPSYFEGFGIPILEAMNCGTAVATSNCTSLPEVAGDAGIFFDPYDVDDIYMHMKSLYESDELRLQLVNTGYERAKKFNWTQTAQLVMNVYRQLINEEEE